MSLDLLNWSDSGGQNSLAGSLSGFGKKRYMPAWASNQTSNPVGSLGTGSFDMGTEGLGGLKNLGNLGFDGGEQKGIMSGFLQQRDGNGATYGGYGTAGMQLAQGLGNAWLGMKQYGVAKDSLNESKRQFGLNFGAQQKMTNMQIEDRMTLAKAEGRDGSYMEKYKV